MNTKQIRSSLLALISAVIWGTAFVAQSVSADRVPPFTFNALRSVIAFIFLFFLDRLMERGRVRRTGVRSKIDKKALVLGGLCCGTFLMAASNLQQAGIPETGAGKAGFITALYVVLVPLLGIFFKKRANVSVWISVVIAVAGLWLLCINGEFRIQSGDLLVLCSALCFAFQILSVDHFVKKVDGIRLSCAQFLVTGVISAVIAAVFESPDIDGILSCALPILYVGVFSSGVAYTLQILAQKDSDPTVISIILSLESVVSVISGALILGDRLSMREYAGCALMFAAVVLAQIPLPGRRPKA